METNLNLSYDLSIVIVTTNGLDFTRDCIQSIQDSNSLLNIEIVLVDNASEPPVCEVIEEEFPTVICIRGEERKGFAENYNIGLVRASGENLMILNDDTIVQPEALDTLVRFIRENREYAFITGRLISLDGSIQPGCSRKLLTVFSYCLNMLLLDPGIPTGRLYYRYLSNQLERRPTGPVEAILGACMLSSRKILDEIGLMDEGYAFYFVEDEWCYRALKVGYKTGYVREAEIVHLGDQTMAKLREWGQQKQYLGALRYFRQTLERSKFQLWFVWGVLLLSYFLRGIAFSFIRLFNPGEDYGRIYFRLVRWVAENYPSRSWVHAAIFAEPVWPNMTSP